MSKNRLSMRVASVSLAALLALSTASAFAREAEPGDDHHRGRGGGEVQLMDDHGVDAILAQRGADDPAGDNRGADVLLAKHGADDPAGDNRGADTLVAKQGVDDPIGDDHGVNA